MASTEGFIGSLLVSAFVAFLVGFLAGFLALALIPIEPDFTTSGFIVFVFGFASGILVVMLVLGIRRATKLRRLSNQ